MKITELYLIVDESAGGGVCAMLHPSGTWMPCVTSNRTLAAATFKAMKGELDGHDLRVKRVSQIEDVTAEFTL